LVYRALFAAQGVPRGGAVGFEVVEVTNPTSDS